MKSFRSAVRSRRKLLTVWALLLLIVALSQLAKWCERNTPVCVAIEQNKISFAIGSLLALAAVSGAIVALRRAMEHRRPKTFRTHPGHFHERVVVIEGRVERVLADSLFEKAKRKATDMYRTAVEDTDSTNRFIHQRFLVSSKEIRRGARLLIEHNVNYGKLSIRSGTKLRIKGVYLHTVAKGRRYGRIHFTHPPKGFIEIL